MKKIYLIRHGLPNFPGGRSMCIGTTDIPLGDTGFAQASEMAASLPPVTAVFSSPLRRAVQTAEAIGLPVTVLEGLRELYAGAWDGLTFDQIRQQYPELYAARSYDPTLPMPGAEDPRDGLARFSAAMETAARLSPGDLAVIAHGGIISRFLEQIGGTRRKPDYTEVISLFYKDGVFYTKDPIHYEETKTVLP